MSAEDPADTLEPNETLLRDLKATDSRVLIIARVVSATYGEIVRRSDKSRRKVLKGLISDGTRTVRFTWWDPPPEGIERGSVLRAANARVREYRGRPELNFDWRSRVEEASALELPQITASDFSARKVADLSPEDEGISVAARVLRIAPKPVLVKGGRRTVHEGILGDESGKIRFSSWKDFDLTSNDTVQISGGYVRAFRGQPQLVLDDRTLVERIDGDSLPGMESLSAVPTSKIGQLESKSAGFEVCFEGIVVGLVPPSGLVYRCPTCARTLTQDRCRIHGRVQGEPDLRARLAVDDGTGSAIVQAGRADTEALLGHPLAEILQRVRESQSAQSVEDELFGRVFGLRVKVHGDATRDDFGLTVHPTEIQTATPSPARTIDSIAQELGALNP